MRVRGCPPPSQSPGRRGRCDLILFTFPGDIPAINLPGCQPLMQWGYLMQTVINHFPRPGQVHNACLLTSLGWSCGNRFLKRAPVCYQDMQSPLMTFQLLRCTGCLCPQITEVLDGFLVSPMAGWPLSNQDIEVARVYLPFMKFKLVWRKCIPASARQHERQISECSDPQK